MLAVAEGAGDPEALGAGADPLGTGAAGSGAAVGVAPTAALVSSGFAVDVGAPFAASGGAAIHCSSCRTSPVVS